MTGQSHHPDQGYSRQPCIPRRHGHSPVGPGIASQHFNDLAGLVLQPFGYCFQDPNRHHIDNVALTILGLMSQLDLWLNPPPAIRDMLVRWRLLLFCRESAMHGHNNQIQTALEVAG